MFNFLKNALRIEPGLKLGAWIVTNWAALTAFIVGGGSLTYLASISAVLQALGPIAWVAAGIGVMCVLVLIWFVYIYTKSMIRMNRLAEIRAENHGVNLVDDLYSRKVIRLSDLFHPYYKVHVKKRFEHCDIFGPGAMVLEGSTWWKYTNFHSCQIVIIKARQSLVGVTALRECTFENCNVFHVTFYMDKNSYLASFSDHVKMGMPVISDGHAGDL